MTARPHEKDQELPGSAEDFAEAEWDRILPPIEESDPEWQAYVRRKVQQALDDPRPPISSNEAFARVYAHIGRRRAARRGGD